MTNPAPAHLARITALTKKQALWLALIHTTPTTRPTPDTYDTAHHHDQDHEEPQCP